MTDRRVLETGTDYLLGWVENGVAVVSFNRPESRNALHSEMYAGFARVLPEIGEDSSIGCLVVTGEGGAFCAGGDVKGFAAGHATQAAGAARLSASVAVDNLRRRQAEVSLAIHRLPKPTIAVLPGAAAGAGLSIALACDFRLATEKAVIITAFANIGASGDFGGSWFLTQLVGHSKAKELYMFSERLTAAEAAAIGIVNRVFDADGFEAGWKAFAQRLASGPGARKPGHQGEHQPGDRRRPRDVSRRRGRQHGRHDVDRRPPCRCRGVHREASGGVHRELIQPAYERRVSVRGRRRGGRFLWSVCGGRRDPCMTACCGSRSGESHHVG